ncbi:hypothetical protein DFP72DRAFT_843931 [Ephemerocybe angulata]|uniref:Uncharacterized protein n=1 Tax=Ephemerocybe angulata TaxID=980116 RepID=A0A8H6M9C7_9AGAR|nr:hypothetical protein DFP72DRAFT_843931 [Tulosesus angulatus]
MYTSTTLFAFVSALAGINSVSGHAAFFHPSMWGFNVSDTTNAEYGYDNRPVAPMRDYTFKQWWFHNHLDKPPNPGDFFELPAGKPAKAEISCDKGATSFFASSPGGDSHDRVDPDTPCPGSKTVAYHTLDFNDLTGCGLAITYKDDVNQVQPEDFTIFSVNQTCVWRKNTDFQVPERMPPCPAGGCICAFFWVPSGNAGRPENYMNGFRCNVTGATSDVPVAKPKVARRCGADPKAEKLQAVPGNCTYGAKQPFYWLQAERNNVFEGEHSPPVYNDLYNFSDGAQVDIFEDSYDSLPDPAPNAPVPVLRQANKSPNGETSGTGTTPTSKASKSCRPRKLPSTDGLRRRSFEDDDNLGLLQRTWIGGALIGMTRRSRTLDPAESRRLWDMW